MVEGIKALETASHRYRIRTIRGMTQGASKTSTATRGIITITIMFQGGTTISTANNSPRPANYPFYSIKMS